MPRKLLPALVLGLVLFSAAAALADGDIYVGGPGAPESPACPIPSPPRAPITWAATSPMPAPATASPSPAGVNHVTLDLMGFTLNGSGSGRYGIYMNGSKNVEIRNGTVTGWATGIREK